MSKSHSLPQRITHTIKHTWQLWILAVVALSQTAKVQAADGKPGQGAPIGDGSGGESHSSIPYFPLEKMVMAQKPQQTSGQYQGVIDNNEHGSKHKIEYLRDARGKPLKFVNGILEMDDKPPYQSTPNTHGNVIIDGANTAIELYDKAIDSYRHDKFNEAKAYFTAALSKKTLDRKTTAKAVVRRGYTQGRLGNDKKAIADCKKALDTGLLDPVDIAEAHRTLGNSYRNLDLGQHEEAIAHYIKAMDSELLKPREAADVFKGMAMSFQALGKDQRAIDAYTGALYIAASNEGALDKESIAVIHYNRGGLYNKLGVLDEATKDAYKVKELQPSLLKGSPLAPLIRSVFNDMPSLETIGYVLSSILAIGGVIWGVETKKARQQAAEKARRQATEKAEQERQAENNALDAALKEIANEQGIVIHSIKGIYSPFTVENQETIKQSLQKVKAEWEKAPQGSLAHHWLDNAGKPAIEIMVKRLWLQSTEYKTIQRAEQILDTTNDLKDLPSRFINPQRRTLSSLDKAAESTDITAATNNSQQITAKQKEKAQRDIDKLYHERPKLEIAFKDNEPELDKLYQEQQTLWDTYVKEPQAKTSITPADANIIIKRREDFAKKYTANNSKIAAIYGGIERFNAEVSSYSKQQEELVKTRLQNSRPTDQAITNATKAREERWRQGTPPPAAPSLLASPLQTQKEGDVIQWRQKREEEKRAEEERQWLVDYVRREKALEQEAERLLQQVRNNNNGSAHATSSSSSSSTSSSSSMTAAPAVSLIDPKVFEIFSGKITQLKEATTKANQLLYIGQIAELLVQCCHPDTDQATKAMFNGFRKTIFHGGTSLPYIPAQSVESLKGQILLPFEEIQKRLQNNAPIKRAFNIKDQFNNATQQWYRVVKRYQQDPGTLQAFDNIIDKIITEAPGQHSIIDIINIADIDKRKQEHKAAHPDDQSSERYKNFNRIFEGVREVRNRFAHTDDHNILSAEVGYIDNIQKMLGVIRERVQKEQTVQSSHVR